MYGLLALALDNSHLRYGTGREQVGNKAQRLKIERKVFLILFSFCFVTYNDESIHIQRLY